MTTLAVAATTGRATTWSRARPVLSVPRTRTDNVVPTSPATPCWRTSWLPEIENKALCVSPVPATSWNECVSPKFGSAACSIPASVPAAPSPGNPVAPSVTAVGAVGGGLTCNQTVAVFESVSPSLIVKVNESVPA